MTVLLVITQERRDPLTTDMHIHVTYYYSLQVKPAGEQYFREVRVPLPSSYERVVAAVARKLQA